MSSKETDMFKNVEDMSKQELLHNLGRHFIELETLVNEIDQVLEIHTETSNIKSFSLHLYYDKFKHLLAIGEIVVTKVEKGSHRDMVRLFGDWHTIPVYALVDVTSESLPDDIEVPTE